MKKNFIQCICSNQQQIEVLCVPFLIRSYYINNVNTLSGKIKWTQHLTGYFRQRGWLIKKSIRVKAGKKLNPEERENKKERGRRKGEKDWKREIHAISSLTNWLYYMIYTKHFDDWFFIFCFPLSEEELIKRSLQT